MMTGSAAPFCSNREISSRGLPSTTSRSAYAPSLIQPSLSGSIRISALTARGLVKDFKWRQNLLPDSKFRAIAVHVALPAGPYPGPFSHLHLACVPAHPGPVRKHGLSFPGWPVAGHIRRLLRKVRTALQNVGNNVGALAGHIFRCFPVNQGSHVRYSARQTRRSA